VGKGGGGVGVACVRFGAACGRWVGGEERTAGALDGRRFSILFLFGLAPGWWAPAVSSSPMWWACWTVAPCAVRLCNGDNPLWGESPTRE
jgi:hypothetical protein